MVKECELCGRQTEERYIATVENVELRVCTRCAKGRHVTPEFVPASRSFSTGLARPEMSGEIVEDYGNRVRIAREHMKIPIKVLAEMISEKEGVISRVEQQKMTPPDPLRKKLEHALKIKLIEEASSESSPYKGGSGKSEEATLGEFVG
jgi:putative transcription factor